jgi:hypothetical protein
MTVQYAVVAQASLAFLGRSNPTLIIRGDMARRAAQSPLIFLNGSWLRRLLPSFEQRPAGSHGAQLAVTVAVSTSVCNASYV